MAKVSSSVAARFLKLRQATLASFITSVAR